MSVQKLIQNRISDMLIKTIRELAGQIAECVCLIVSNFFSRTPVCVCVQVCVRYSVSRLMPKGKKYRKLNRLGSINEKSHACLAK